MNRTERQQALHEAVKQGRAAFDKLPEEIQKDVQSVVDDLMPEVMRDIKGYVGFIITERAITEINKLKMLELLGGALTAIGAADETKH